MTDDPRGDSAPAGWSRRERLALVLVIVLGAGICFAWVGRPLDHRIRSPWRQADYLAIARNFSREGMNILYPRIDWRGATPGYVEGELPVLPWVAAVLFRTFGYHEQLLRLPSALLGVASLILFAALARRLLPPVATVFATAAYTLNPLLLHLATAMQPEPLMLFLSLVAVALSWRWADRPHRAGGLLLAAAAIAGAILAKATAVYLGLVLGGEILRRFGRRAFVLPEVHLAALLAILPPVAWYGWALHFWTAYGNSLGLSNGDHFLTLAMLAPPRFLIGILEWETLGVFTPFGWALALAALVSDRRRIARPLAWYLATWALYVPAAKTTAADWAYYYHAISVAPACLLMGGGVAALGRDGCRLPARWSRWTAGLLAAATLIALVALDVVYLRLRDDRPELLAMRTCSLAFAPSVPSDQMIVVAGSPDYDQYGRSGAYNISMPFAWMDRRGFNYPENALGVDTLDRIAEQGGRYWMASAAELESEALRRAMRERKYRLLATCAGGYFLYDLRPR